MWKDFFYFSKSDRKAVTFFIAVILATTLLRFLLRNRCNSDADGELIVQTDTMTWQVSRTPSYKERSDSVYHSANRTADFRQSDTGHKDGNSRHQYAEHKGLSDTVQHRVFPKRDKYPYGTVIDLNLADTTELKRVPGIGSYYANRIVDYRNRLGGYVDPQQLADISGLPDSVRNWFLVTDSFQVRRLMVNSASISELRAHPYMNFYKAREIVEYRERNGRIKNPAQLSFFEEFSGQDLERLEPYLCFD